MALVTPQEWKLSTGTAWMLSPGDAPLTRSFILAAAGGTGKTDYTAFRDGVDHSSYSLLDALHERSRSLILIGYDDGTAGLANLAKAVTETVQRALAQRVGSAPLVAGGIGRGALAARYGLVKLENMRFAHGTAVYYSYNGTSPTQQEAGELHDMGEWPQLPRLFGLASEEFTNELDFDLDKGPFDDTTTGARNPGGPLITSELGSWLLDRLP
ncbi:hypothetical protein [Streptomyces boninensis]|uniref:hypothetical protein n=1 Tax=Streptomyces boninensis TaxID=2039455 RepID=UPI003B21982B